MTYQFIQDIADNIADKTGNACTYGDVLVSLCVVSAFFVFLCLSLFPAFGRFSFWHIVGAVVVGVSVAFILDTYVDLVDWFQLGIQFTDIGASLYVVGSLMFIAVLAINIIRTSGRRLIR